MTRRETTLGRERRWSDLEQRLMTQVVDQNQRIYHLEQQLEAARNLACSLEEALHHLGAWDPASRIGAEQITEDMARGGAASIQKAR